MDKNISDKTNLKSPCEEEFQMPIDFVVTWVDMDDPKWRDDFFKYAGKINNSHNSFSEARFRDYGFFEILVSRSGKICSLGAEDSFCHLWTKTRMARRK